MKTLAGEIVTFGTDGQPVLPESDEQGETACCYAKSEKSWIDDPAGISWETFHTTGESIDYGDGSGERVARVAHEKPCCAPAPKVDEPAAASGCPAA